jgi:transcriptional regulator with XRE-family HTH domain
VPDNLDKPTADAVVTLGKHLREVRESLGITPTVFAKRVGMDLPNYAKIEQGKKNVTMDSLVRIASGLGADLSVRFVIPKKRKGA